jgi:hypothetical protein
MESIGPTESLSEEHKELPWVTCEYASTQYGLRFLLNFGQLLFARQHQARF